MRVHPHINPQTASLILREDLRQGRFEERDDQILRILEDHAKREGWQFGPLVLRVVRWVREDVESVAFTAAMRNAHLLGVVPFQSTDPRVLRRFLETLQLDYLEDCEAGDRHAWLLHWVSMEFPKERPL